ncbi:MAG TPA: DUF1080 domain-containing protein [Candidatus Hydrogenedentes bacterium]|nr:DUF1080 domain-containing protein [Candidatus Hydrogenedentota bacterium]
MRFHTRAGVVLCATVLAFAASAQGQTVAEGQWINLFDGESLFGWTVFGDGEWKVEEGVLVCERGTGGWLATTCQFKDFELAAKMRVKPGCSTGLVVRGGLEGHPSENGSAVVTLAEPKESEAAWREIVVKALGDEISATIDGQPVEGLKAGRARGYVGVQYHHNNRARVEVAELRLRPLALEAIFNGENLDGWNIIPGRASKFQVVDGALNITDGNGQIETANVYKDFLLQLDIISNGDRLNSGVFYRGPVGVFWKGYESQVRNEWRRENREAPIDYGTGGNYGNQPARKVVSTDHEWFTKTIVCEGNHAAVWINGYLVSDYRDTRPVSPEGDGKAGYVPGPGTIHLQGHDPTTDLSFRNIHIQQYP